MNSYREHWRIPATHPCLPGHFPGRPLVPGVVLLDAVAAALERWRGQRIGRLVQVKFLAPLLPEEEVELELQAGATRYRFRLLRATAVVASGELEARS